MLVRLGTRTGSLDVADLILDCHAKIRRFIAIAKRLAASEASDFNDIRDAAAGISRYFVEAFPLHVADEDEIVLPKLVRTDASLQRALDRMHDDHLAHALLIQQFTSLCETLRDYPERYPELAPRLRKVVAQLEPLLEEHLVMEETEIVPALRRLAREDQDAMTSAMRARRTPA